jgi:arachidonate 5-lipoxygenase
MPRKSKKIDTLSCFSPAVPLPADESVARPGRRPDPEVVTSGTVENLSFEGGGAKGYAYIGAVQVLEERGIYPLGVRRTAGTSVGSLFALLTALGCSSEYMIEKVPPDFEALAKDGGGGKIGSLLRATRRRGMHPGDKLFAFLGDILFETTGSADCTFAQLEERCGRELCVPVTNVTRMMTEYCHVKTTPNMPVRVAVRMSMSLPVLLQPVNLASAVAQSSDPWPEVYVDGGLLCNNPAHAYDGWWLSMDPQQSFLRRLSPLDRASEHYPRASRFHPPNPRTLGFTLFALEENDITRTWVPDSLEPQSRPDTNAARRALQREIDAAATRSLQEPVQRVLDVLDAVDIDRDGVIDMTEFRAALDELAPNDLQTVFGPGSLEEIFALLDTDGSGAIEFGELLTHVESVGLDVTTQLVGFPAKPPRSAIDFALNMLEAVNRDLARSIQGVGDRDRTVPINTDYVGTTTFDLSTEDLDFLVEAGRRHTRAILDARGIC